MRNQKNLVVENTNIFMSGHVVKTQITLVNGIGKIEVHSSHYRADTIYSKETLINRLKTALKFIK